MNRKHSPNRKFRRILTNILSIFAILAIALPVTSVAYAVSASPFVGHWQATDIDGSDMRLTVSGPPSGPFQITWTESYISFCDGEAGIVRGTGQINESNPYLLEADLHLDCFTTGAATEFRLAWRYHFLTGTLSSRYDNGVVIIWRRPGTPLPPPSTLGLRVNYGHDWVESFYEEGHMAWVTVTESDGVTVKATAELMTEPKDFWNEETGFTTDPESWIPGPPDIQPNDWVFGWVDNGASAQVQIGDISGTIDLANDSIEGTISAPWFSSELEVDCHSWGAPLPEEILKYDAVLPDGEDTYSCFWAGEWDIQPYQDIGVGYSGPDGHWVANTFFIPLPSFAAYMPSAIEGYDWPLGNTITLNINDGEYTAQAISEQRPDFPEGETRVLFELWQDDFTMEAGDHILMTDEALGFTKGLYVADLQVLEIDLSTQTVSGIYEPTYPDFWIWLDGQAPLDVLFDENTWAATFAEMIPGTWGTVAQDDGDHDGTVWDFYVPNTRFTVFPEWNYLEGYEWPDGAVVSISVAGKEVCSTEAVAGFPEWDPSNTFLSVNFPEGCTIGGGDLITLSYESLSFTHQIQELTITDVDLDFDTVAGTAVFDPEQYILHTWIHEVEGSYMQLSAEGGSWLADFGSQGFDLQAGISGRVELVDQASNATAVEWYIPKIEIKAFPMADVVWGYGWPEGSQVHLTLNGEADFVPPAIVGPAPWGDPNDIMAYFELTGYDLVPGDVVTLSGSGLEQTHTVRNLSVTAVDAAANTVTGIADEELYVWVHGFDGTELHLTPQGGTWLADFGSIPFDLIDGMCGRAEMGDESGNSTAADWCVPPPARIVVQITDDWFRAENFAPNTSLSFRVYDALGGNLLVESTTAPTDDSGTITYWVGDVVDLVPGRYVVVSDSVTSREIVLEALTFNVFDASQGILLGTAPEPFGRSVWVGIGWENDGWSMEIPTDADGHWVADFGAPVPTDYQWVAAQIFDADGDASELRPASQIIFLRPRCGLTYTVQAGGLLEVRYGSWLAFGEELAIQNAQHLTVELVLDGQLVTGVQQPVVPGSEIPCGASEGTYGVFYVAQVGPLSPGTHVARVTYIFDESVTDGYDADGDGEPDWYGPGEVLTREFTLIVQ